MSKPIYIAHPFRNDPDLNTARTSAICWRLHAMYPELTFISPIHNFVYLDPDTDVTAQCMDLLSMCGELWVFGDYEQSTGCLMEIEKAKEMCIPIHYCFMRLPL